MSLSIQNKERDLGQKDCTIWEMQEVRECSGVFIGLKKYDVNFICFIVHSDKRNIESIRRIHAHGVAQEGTR